MKIPGLKSTAVCVLIPFISCPMMWRVFDSVCHRVHLPVLHDHLHPERSLSLSKQPLFHPLKQHQRLLNGSVSPGGWRSVMALQFLPFLVAHVRMTPEGRQRKESDIIYWLVHIYQHVHMVWTPTCELNPQRGRRVAESCRMHAWQHEVRSLWNTVILLRNLMNVECTWSFHQITKASIKLTKPLHHVLDTSEVFLLFFLWICVIIPQETNSIVCLQEETRFKENCCNRED